MKLDTQSADELRNAIWKNRGFPVNPVIIANRLGIKVFKSNLPDKVYGALIKEKGKDPIIIAHYADSENRQRFTCAHELGHYVYRLQQNEDDEEYEFLDLRNQQSSEGIREEEIFANQFAANLLMPEKEVRKLAGEEKSSLLMALYFDVSTEAMKIRLKNLQIKC